MGANPHIWGSKLFFSVSSVLPATEYFKPHGRIYKGGPAVIFQTCRFRISNFSSVQSCKRRPIVMENPPSPGHPDGVVRRRVVPSTQKNHQNPSGVCACRDMAPQSRGSRRPDDRKIAENCPKSNPCKESSNSLKSHLSQIDQGPLKRV